MSVHMRACMCICGKRDSEFSPYMLWMAREIYLTLWPLVIELPTKCIYL